MIFKDFANIDIDTDRGVSPPGKDTMLMAKYARDIKFESALEIGTGTGFIPIYLSKCGLNCIGSDINYSAINCAKKNAAKNECKINFYLSDLFENIQNKYDLIIFNIPLGNSSSPVLSKYLEMVKSIVPKNKFFAELSFKLIKTQRANLVKCFLDRCTDFLSKNGKVILFLHKSEQSLVSHLQNTILDRIDNFEVILIQF